MFSKYSRYPLSLPLLAAVILPIPLPGLATPLEEIVVTANRQAQILGSVPSNIAIVDQQSLVSVDHTHPNEIMQRVAGVWISRGNGQESLSAIRSPVLTGAGGCGAFLMAQDGIALRASGFCNVNELFESHSEIAEKIEVIRGPGPASYGSNALHGLVNVITPDLPATRSTFQVEGGPHDYYRAKWSTGGRNWRVDASGTSDGGYKEDSGFGQQKFTGKVRGSMAGFNTTTTLSLTNLNQETAGFVKGERAYRVPELRRNNPNPEAYRDARSARLYSRWEKDLSGGRQLIFTPYFRRVEMAFLQHFLPGQPLEKNRHTSIGFQSSLGLGGSLIVGLDGEITRGYLEETQKTPTPGSAFLQETIPIGKHYDYQVDAGTLAIFGQYRTMLATGTEVVAGARLERVRYQYDNRMIDGRTRDDGTPCGFGGCRFSRPADRNDDFVNLSPKLGIIHDLGGDRQIYAQLSRGFRAPQATELYRLQAGQTVSNIDSVQLDSVETGFRGGSDLFSFDISLYAMNKDNFIFRDTNRENIDNGKTSHRGLEMTLHWKVSEAVSTSVYWTWARHRYRNSPSLTRSDISGNDIDTAPRNMGSMNIAWQPDPRLRAELEWVHLGRYFMDPQNTVRYPGHDLFNLRLSHDWNERWTAFLRIMNLTDTRYAERADFGFGSERYFVGEPRSVYLGIRHNLARPAT